MLINYLLTSIHIHVHVLFTWFNSSFLYPKELKPEDNIGEQHKSFPSDSKCEKFAAMNDMIVEEIKELIADENNLPGKLQSSLY